MYRLPTASSPNEPGIDGVPTFGVNSESMFVTVPNGFAGSNIQ